MEDNQFSETIRFCVPTFIFFQILKKNDDLASFVKPLNLEGSIFKWANENKPLVDSNNNVTKLVHPVAYKYGLPYLKWTNWKWP